MKNYVYMLQLKKKEREKKKLNKVRAAGYHELTI